MLWYRNKLVIEFIYKFFPNFKSLLEVGAGSGMVLSSLLEELSDRDIHA